ncbi:ASCH domain-containing protein [Deinococcus sp. Marseille-Q6407]|uniref:ASCH domain-containing protein n=1 Tax=Deinococcus sp. Marseille-Q6407 TaxID=2969223 RepID=UPI0021C01D06|nr:ASCH domain-containing protein [Deinococcus sp. Marseille-Q6407]
MTPLPQLHFHPEYRAAVQSGRKQTTIRWGEAVEVGPVLLRFGDDPQGWPAHITRLEPFPLAALTDAQAQADGFQDRAELLERLRFHYPELPVDAQVKVVHFRLD